MVKELIAGLLIGIVASLVAGLFIAWKGQEIVARITSVPSRRRRWRVAQAFLMACRGYPFRFLHVYTLATIGALLLLLGAFCALATALAFVASDKAEEGLQSPVLAAIANPSYLTLAWIFVGFTAFSAVLIVSFFRKHYAVELLVPVAARDLQRIRECVFLYGSREQALRYCDAETQVSTHEDVQNLLRLADETVGGKLALISYLAELLRSEVGHDPKGSVATREAARDGSP